MKAIYSYDLQVTLLLAPALKAFLETMPEGEPVQMGFSGNSNAWVSLEATSSQFVLGVRFEDTGVTLVMSPFPRNQGWSPSYSRLHRETAEPEQFAEQLLELIKGNFKRED